MIFRWIIGYHVYTGIGVLGVECPCQLKQSIHSLAREVTMDPELKKSLQDNYHDLLDRVRFVFGNGKSSVEDALQAALEELQTLGKHTEEEIHDLGEVLKDDVRELTFQAHELQEGLRHTIEFDKQYLTQEIREKLQQLADQTTLDMLNFKEELAERQRRRAQTPRQPR
ncbi:MAG TPA: hypothetical protein DD979_01985 [Gammaproteobacteria bacterium]|nr:hypothetical protein [Gammaproteobacteria bacterium]